LKRYQIVTKTNGLRKKFYRYMPFVNGSMWKYDRKDFETSTIFDKIPNSIAIDVPAYSTGYSVELMPILERHGSMKRGTNWKGSPTGRRMS